MAYYGTNSVLAQAHWDASQSSNSYFNTLDDDYYVVCGSMSSENAATGSNTNVVRGSNGFHLLDHDTAHIEPIFAYGSYSSSNGNANHGAHMGICVMTN